MKTFIAFFKKEILESVRSGKLIILGIIFAVFGIMNPAIAKLTPVLFDVLSEELASNGMIITEIQVDALTSWTQFFKNVPLALAVFTFLYSNTFTKEYESETLIPLLTKGLSRYKVVMAKSGLMLLLWSAGYFLMFGVTYLYNSYFWDNGIASGLFPAIFNWWIFGIFTVSLIVLFSVISRSYIGVLLGVGGTVLALYLFDFLPRISRFLPCHLIDSAGLLVGAEVFDIYIVAEIIALVISAFCIAIAIPVFNKKQL